MSESGREALIRKAINEKYAFYAERIINEIKALPKECCQSGDDSTLDSVWKEWAHQLQYEQSIFMEAYEQTIRDLCRKVILKMPEHEVKLLWAGRDELYLEDDIDELTDFFAIKTLIEDLEEELFRRVSEIAINEDLGG
ncbi:MAG: hypothetical protein PHV93_04470 [Candidatus Pacebacteria bacterium]|nr:hypothetical protein [Candidatus Paceibacterota bacterium]